MLIVGIIILAVNRLTFGVGTYAGNGLVVFRESGLGATRARANINKLFANVKPGDKVLVLRDNFTYLTYPGETGMYKCWRLGGGDLSDIPDKELEQLIDMGWIE